MLKITIKHWNCPYCEDKGIKDDIRQCPNCGKIQDVNTCFYIDENAPEYVSEEIADKAIKDGFDWTCSYCECLNENARVDCKQCGAPKRATETADENEEHGDLSEVLNTLKDLNRMSKIKRNKIKEFIFTTPVFIICFSILFAVLYSMFIYRYSNLL